MEILRKMWYGNTELISRHWLVVAGLMAAPFFTGCGGSDGLVEPLAPAGGKLLIDDQPMDGVVINFNPVVAAKGRRGGSAITNSSGEFTATDLVQNKPGLPAGKYTLSYSRRRKPDGTAAPPFKPGDKHDPKNIQVETLPMHLTSPDSTKPAYQVDIPKEGNTKLELKASTKDGSRPKGPGMK